MLVDIVRVHLGDVIRAQPTINVVLLFLRMINLRIILHKVKHLQSW